MKSKQGKTYCCSECRQDFSLEDFVECRCTYPGSLLKCIDCKHYKDMMLYVQRRKPQLEALPEEQLDAIISASGFWHRSMERGSTEAQNTQAAQVDWTDAEPSLQLSLFNEFFDKDSHES
jgi:hypothetical protein